MEKIISCFCHIRELYRQAKRRFCEFRKENWKDTGRLPYWAAVLLFALCAGLMSGTFMRPAWIGFLLVFLLAVGLNDCLFVCLFVCFLRQGFSV